MLGGRDEIKLVCACAEEGVLLFFCNTVSYSQVHMPWLLLRPQRNCSGANEAYLNCSKASWTIFLRQEATCF